MSVTDVMELIKANGVKFADLRFTDTKGKEQHVSIPARLITPDFFTEGKMFDGSSVAGWKGIDKSDMILMPDADTVHLDPFYDEPTIIVRCDVLEADTMTGYDRDPRSVAKRAEEYLRSTGIGEEAFFGPEPEFFLFKTDEEGRPTTKTNDEAGYFDLGPLDHGESTRREICLALEKMGYEIEASHHEVAPGQHEIDFKYSDAVQCADKIMTFKLAVKTIAQKNGLHATFMPKPIFGIAGSGMTCPCSATARTCSLMRTATRSSPTRPTPSWLVFSTT